MTDNGRVQRRAVIVAAGAPDRRLAEAVRCARRIPALEHRVVHVAVDGDDAEQLGLWWMGNELEGFPLEVVDDRGGVAATLGTQVQAQRARGFDQVVVLAGYRCARGVGRWLLHDHTAEAVCKVVNRIPGAVGVLVPVTERRDRRARYRERALTTD